MPRLPDRPDLDQLRRQARELLRAAVGRDPAAVARIRAVAERMTLSAAQLAIASEYGCRTWAALRAEVERRRPPLDRWSFGGAAAIETPSGLLLPEVLIVGVDDAVLHTTLTRWQNDARPDPEAPSEPIRGIDEEIRELEASARTGAVTVVDDQGATYALRVREMSGAHGSFARSIRFRVDPVPGRGIEWLELRGQNGSAARLLPSPRAAVRLGQLTSATASPHSGQRPGNDRPPGRDALPDAADRTDGPRHHLDLVIILPPIDGMILQLDTLRFSPRLDPLARRLRLTCTGSAEQIAVDLDLAD